MATAKTLLIVEDDDLTRQAVALVLRRAGYEVIAAANGEEALASLRSGSRPDLILLDMLMPVLDGWHFLAAVRRELSNLPIPIIVTTSSIISREWALDHGCQGFIRKPVTPEALVEEIQRCLA